jgi:MscS family membrane protein
MIEAHAEVINTFLGISLWRYAAFFVFIAVSFLAKKLTEIVVVRWGVDVLSRTPFKYDHMTVKALGRPLSAFVLVTGLYGAFSFLGAGGVFPVDVMAFICATYGVAVGVIVVWFVYRLVDVFVSYLHEIFIRKEKMWDEQFVPMIEKSLRILVLALGVLTILSTLNIDVRSLLAGLGIGGLAVALAAQDTLGNFFGSIALLVDRPFKVGDWIIVGDKVNGFVESIGFRSTTVRTWPKTLVTIPNKVLSGEVIDNWTRMPKRRVKQTVGVTYETTPEQMEALTEKITELIRNEEGVHQEFIMVRFTDFGDSSLDILLYYFTKSVSWPEHLDVRQRVNIQVMRCLREMGLSIAFPSRMLYFDNNSDRHILRDKGTAL